MNFSQRLHRVIPAGCHTYSRGDDQFPSNAPQLLINGKGSYVYDHAGNKYLDYGMGLRSVAVGYAEPEINRAAMQAMAMGNCLPRPSLVELEAAELACSLLGHDMIKFTKNGSTATTVAVKLARAATGRTGVLFADQPFFSYDDWFIQNTRRNLGCGGIYTAIRFRSIETLELTIETSSVACVILEPKDYDLKAIRALCDKHGIVLIFDEMITGFRYDWPSVTQTQEVKPDLACYGKAMANGFSVACVAGKRELMEIGARPDMFLASTTHGAEMCGLAAFMATVRFMEKHNVAAHLRDYRQELEGILPKCMRFQRHELVAHYNELMLTVEKTLFMQEMVKRGVLMPYIAHSYRHGEKELEMTRIAVDGALEAIAQGAILEGAQLRPVFQ